MSIFASVMQQPKPLYEILEYIQSTGTQYIDSGVKALKGYTSTIRFQATSMPTSGAYKEGWVMSVYASTSSMWRCGINGDILFTNGGFAYSQSSPLAETVGTGTSPSDFIYSLIIFGQNENGSIQHVANSKYKLWYLKISDANSKPVRDYVPAKRIADSAIGLYDRVEKKFYENAGTGAFAAGSATGEVVMSVSEPTLVTREVAALVARGEKEMDGTVDLYNAGDQCASITGGWTQTGHSNNNTFEAASEELYLSCYGGWTQTNGVQTANAVNLTGYTKVCIELKIDHSIKVDDGSYYTWMHFGLWDSRFDGQYNNPPGGKTFSINGLSEDIANKRITLTVDVDGMASAYVGLLYRNYGGHDDYFPCHIYRVYAIDPNVKDEIVSINREIATVYRTVNGVVREVFPGKLPMYQFIDGGKLNSKLQFMLSGDGSGGSTPGAHSSSGNGILISHNECGGSMFITTEKVNVSKYSKLSARAIAYVNNTRNSMWFSVMLFKSMPADLNGRTYYCYYNWYFTGAGGTKLVEAASESIYPYKVGVPCSAMLNLSNIYGEYYIALEVTNDHNGSRNGSITIDSFMLE